MHCQQSQPCTETRPWSSSCDSETTRTSNQFHLYYFQTLCGSSSQEPRRRRDTRTFWPDSANCSNAGFNFWWSLIRCPGESTWTNLSPLGCCLDWRYCIWNARRLDSWHLLQDPGERREAGLHKRWMDGLDRKESCVHCIGLVSAARDTPRQLTVR